MKKLFYLLACHLLINCSTTVNAQQAETFDFESEMFLPGANYYDILKRGTDFYENHPDSNEDGDYSAFNRWALMWKDRVNQPGAVPGDFNIATKAYQSLLVNPLCNGSANVPSYWSPLGPMSMPIQSLGIITAVAALPSEPNIVYAGTSNGGLFRTTNAGVGASPTWVNITDQSHLPGAGISDIIINPTINSNGYHDLYIAYGAQRWNVYGIGVLKSTNNGSTWFQTDLNTTFFGGYKVVKKMLMHPSNSQILYAITNNEVYKTTVGGVNVSGTGWPAKAFQIAANNPLINLNDLTMNGTNSNIVYTTGSGEIWRYDDATTAWSRLDLNASFVIPVAPPGSTYLSKTVSLSSPYNSCYALIRYTYILNGPPYTKSYKYEIKIYNETTPTPTWSVIANPGMYGPYFIVSPAQNNVMYIGDDANRLINKSVNSGQSFSAVSVYNGTYNATTYTHADVRAVELIEASTTNGTGNNDFMLVGNDGGILYSRINGSTPAAYMNGSTPKVNWTNINGTGMNITQFSGFGGLETTKDLLVAGAQDNDIFRFYQGNWTVNVSCDGYECLIDPININTANQQPYVYGQKDCGLPAELILRQSSDGGQSFSPPATSIPEKGSGRKPMQFNTTNQNFYMAYRNLFRSATPSLILNTVPPTLNPSKISDFQTNSGVPSCWSVSSFDVNEDNPLIIYLAFEGPTFDLDMNSCSQNCQPLGAACPTNTTYVCCPFTAGPVSVDKKIFKTTDGGANWFDKTGGTSTNALHAVEWGGITDVVMNPDNPNEVYLTFNGFWDNPGGSGIGYGRVARSFDGGVNWEEYSQGLREFPVNQIVFQRGANAAYIATDIGVFYRKTDDPNSQWECFNNNLPISVYTDLEINYCSQKLRASSYGRGMWESDLASSTVTLASPGTINWNTPRRLANNLIIGNGVTLNITSDVNIAKGRKITVAPGGTLKIDGGHLYNGCNEMWDKINVDGPTATLNVLTNAIIEDAYIAAYTNNGGVIKIKNSILDQNQIHVHIENVTTTSYAGYLFACTLQNTTGLQKPFTPGTLSSTAIEILNCNNIVIGNDAFSTQKNRLKDLINTGIRIVSSSVTIINCDIALATTNLSSRGIFASNTTSTPYDLNIGTRAGLICTAYSKNHISNFYHGIYINKNFSVHIVDNDIELIGLRGIYISQCLQTIEILKKMNTIGNYIHNSPAISYGIQLASNPSASSISIANNTLDLNKDAVGIYLTEYTCTDNPNTIISGNIISKLATPSALTSFNYLSLAYTKGIICQSRLGSSSALTNTLPTSCTTASIDYAPDPNHYEYTPVKKLRIAIHVFQKNDGTLNFQESDAAAITFITNAINGYLCLNYRYQNLIAPSPSLLPGEGIFIDKANIQFELIDPVTGDPRIYFHRNEYCWDFSNPDAGVRQTKADYAYLHFVTLDESGYGFTTEQKTNTLHIFISGNYNAIGGQASEIGGARWIVETGWYYNYIFTGNYFAAADNLVHETGHSLGLNHIWESGSCLIKPQCSTNNCMDYCTQPRALYQCQYGLMHYNLEGLGGYPTYPIGNAVIKDYCTYDAASTITITNGQNVTWITKKELKGDLVIEPGAALTVRCQLSLPKGGRIIVQRTGKLVVHGGVLTNVCGEMWEGIDVWGDPNLASNASNQGKVEIKNGAIIENARDAIYTIKRPTLGTFDWGYTGGIVFGDGSTFRNNRRDVAFLSYKKINTSRFNNCTFETTEALHDPAYVDAASNPYAAPYHVTLFDVNRVAFNGCDFKSTGSAASFLPANKGGGINSYEAGYYVGDYGSSDHSTFTDLYSGLVVNSIYQTPTRSVSIAESNFVRVYQGVYGRKHYVTLKDNIFTYIPNLTTGCYGAYFLDANGINATGNEFTGVTGATNFGIIARGSDTHGGLIKDNDFTNLQWATQTEMTNPFLMISCNHYNDNDYSINVNPLSGNAPNVLGDQATGCLTTTEYRASNDFTSTNVCDINTNLVNIWKYYAWGYPANTIPSLCTITSPANQVVLNQCHPTSFGIEDPNKCLWPPAPCSPPCDDALKYAYSHETNPALKQYYFNELIDYYSSNDLVDELVDFLTDDGTENSIRLLVGHYIDTKDTVNVADLISHHALATKEDTAFVRYYNIQLSLLKQHKRLDELSSGQKDTVTMIAAGSTRMAIIAENYLEFLKDTVIFVNPEMIEGARLATPDIIATKLEEQPTLGNNIPNPFNNTTTINYYLPKELEGSIVISNVFGAKIKVFKLASGTHEVLFNKDNLASGIYFYQLIVGGTAESTKKMIIY